MNDRPIACGVSRRRAPPDGRSALLRRVATPTDSHTAKCVCRRRLSRPMQDAEDACTWWDRPGSQLQTSPPPRGYPAVLPPSGHPYRLVLSDAWDRELFLFYFPLSCCHPSFLYPLESEAGHRKYVCLIYEIDYRYSFLSLLHMWKVLYVMQKMYTRGEINQGPNYRSISPTPHIMTTPLSSHKVTTCMAWCWATGEIENYVYFISPSRVATHVFFPLPSLKLGTGNRWPLGGGLVCTRRGWPREIARRIRIRVSGNQHTRELANFSREQCWRTHIWKCGRAHADRE